MALYDINKFRYWSEKVLPTVFDDALSYSEVLGKVVIKLNEIIDLANTQNEQMTIWYNEINANIATWESDFTADIEAWETSVTNALDEWKTGTITDIETKFNVILSDLEDWEQNFVDEYNALKAEVEQIADDAEAAKNAAAASATAAAESATDAETAAQSVSSSSAQIATNKNNIESIESSVYKDIIDTSIFVNKSISLSSGAMNNSNIRISTENYINKRYKKVKCLNGYQYNVAAFDSTDTFIGIWDGTTFVKNSFNWKTDETTFNLLNKNYNYKIMVAKIDITENIDPSEASNIIWSVTTDNELNEEGFPADSKTTGNKISETNSKVNVLYGNDITNTFVWTNNYGIRDNGNSFYSANYKCTDFIDFSNISKFIYTAFRQNTSATVNILSCAFYDENQNYINVGVHIFNDNLGFDTKEMVIPNGAKYVRFTTYKTNDYGDFKIYVIEKEDYNPYTQINENTKEIANIKTDILQPMIKKETNKVYMYIPTTNGKYIEYDFVKVNDNSINALGWRLCYMYLDNADFTHIKYICYTGEWEMAIKIKREDITDFIGLGNHGDEIQTSFNLFVDGKSITETDVFDARKFNVAQLVTTLTMYEPSDNTTVAGIHTRIDTIDALRKTVTIDNYVKFANNYTMKASYLFMSPLSRYHDDTQITDKFIDNVDYILTDCSTTTFSPADANNGVGKTKDNLTEYQFWGEDLGIHGYAKILDRKAPEGNTLCCHIADEESYNKIYMSMCKDNETVQANDIWIMKTEFYCDSGYNS